ncbi:MAG: hypothetical protein AABZ12_00640 [Planctomycetota bacterium]
MTPAGRTRVGIGRRGALDGALWMSGLIVSAMYLFGGLYLLTLLGLIRSA